MKKIESEEFNEEELEQIEEFASFTAEEFRCNETLNDNKEEFEVKEIQAQSFVDKENYSEKDNKSLFEKVKNHIKFSTASGTAASTSISLITAVAAVAIGVVPIINDDVEEIEETIDFGHINFINYRIDYNLDEDDEINKDITIFFEDEVKEGFKVEVKNLVDLTIKELDLTNDYITFESLNEDFYNFEVSIVDENLKILDSYIIDVNTVTDYHIALEVPFEYTITYNEDETTNLYVKLIYEGEYVNAEFINSLNIIDASNNVLDYEFIEKDGVLFVENIKEKNYDFKTSSYYLKDGNEYLINSMIQRNLMGEEFSCNVEAEFDNLKLSVYNVVTSDIELNVKYLDYGEEEKFIISKDEINNNDSLDIKLSRICEELDISLNGKYKALETIEGFNDYKGNTSKDFNYTSKINPELYNILELTRCEILNSDYMYGYNVPIRLYFDGYIKRGSKLTVNVYDSSSNLIDSITDIEDLSSYVEFLDLDDTQVLRFEYIIYDEQNEVSFRDYYETQVNIPDEYLNLDASLSHVNPGEIFVTYNKDNTYNAYFNVNFVNNSEFDVEYKISLLINSEYVKYEYLGDDKIGAIYNISSEGFYAVNYSKFVHVGINYYAISGITYPSGGLEIYYNEGGYIDSVAYIDYSIYQDPNIYYVKIYSKEIGDLNVNVKFDDNEQINFIIPESEVITDTSSFAFYLDLSEYTFSHADVTIFALANDLYTSGEVIKENMEIVGDEYIQHCFTFTI